MDFDTAVNHILRYEGVDSDDPADNGGRTRFGISQEMHPELDVAHITIDQAKAIYQRDYWIKGWCSAMPPALQLPMFDACVNVGVKQAAKILQRCLAVPADGKIGDKTLQALGRADPDELWIKFMAERALFYTGHEDFARFGRGWFRRLMDVASISAPQIATGAS